MSEEKNSIAFSMKLQKLCPECHTTHTEGNCPLSKSNVMDQKLLGRMSPRRPVRERSK